MILATNQIINLLGRESEAFHVLRQDPGAREHFSKLERLVFQAWGFNLWGSTTEPIRSSMKSSSSSLSVTTVGGRITIPSPILVFFAAGTVSTLDSASTSLSVNVVSPKTSVSWLSGNRLAIFLAGFRVGLGPTNAARITCSCHKWDDIFPRIGCDQKIGYEHAT